MSCLSTASRILEWYYGAVFSHSISILAIKARRSVGVSLVVFWESFLEVPVTVLLQLFKD